MSPFRTPFAAIFQTEVLLNTKRVAPYAMMILFGANAWLWTVRGPAVYYGWATNSEYLTIRNLGGFSFMTLPLFTALIMGDPVIRDLREGVAPLIFSKPISRATYILGKFFGNFFVLVCCQAGFVLMLVLLQWFPTPEMIVQPARIFPFIKHFFVIVVISHLMIAAVLFTVGTLTRNPKTVYALAVIFYPLYVLYQILLLRGLPPGWRIALDPLLMSWSDTARGAGGVLLDADAINQLTFSFDSGVIVNRALMILIAAACLMVLHARFSTVERPKRIRENDRFTTIDLVTREERLYREMESFGLAHPMEIEAPAPLRTVAIPKVNAITDGARASLKQFVAASEVELRLLLAERGLIVLLPVATLISVLGLGYYEVAADPSYSAAYAGRTADSILLFLIGIAIFFTGEAMHRDRELRVEPVLWGMPVPNSVLLLSKFSTTFLLSVTVSMSVGLAAIALQLLRGHTPVDLLTYLTIYSVILVPGMAFMIAAATALNVLLRDKHLAYAACMAVAGGLFYLFSLGYNHWLYNPVLYGLWTPSDLTGGAGRLPQILAHRVYCLALATLCLSLAHIFYERKTTKGLQEAGHLSGKSWTILIISAAIATAVITGFIISA